MEPKHVVKFLNQAAGQNIAGWVLQFHNEEGAARVLKRLMFRACENMWIRETKYCSFQ